MVLGSGRNAPWCTCISGPRAIFGDRCEYLRGPTAENGGVVEPKGWSHHSCSRWIQTRAPPQFPPPAHPTPTSTWHPSPHSLGPSLNPSAESYFAALALSSCKGSWAHALPITCLLLTLPPPSAPPNSSLLAQFHMAATRGSHVMPAPLRSPPKWALTHPTTLPHLSVTVLLLPVCSALQTSHSALGINPPAGGDNS